MSETETATPRLRQSFSGFGGGFLVVGPHGLIRKGAQHGPKHAVTAALDEYIV